MNEWLRRLHYLFNRGRLEQELAEEMEAHREMAVRDGGGSFGNTLRLREEARDAWGWTWIDRLGQDLRYAARVLRHSPGFTVTAVLMLALGIGVNVAAFSFFSTMVLRPLAVREPDTLLRFQRRAPEGYASALPYPEMAFFREYSQTLSALLALNVTRLTIDAEEKPVSAQFVTANLFGELGAKAALGRLLVAVRDEAPDADAVVVLDHDFWQGHFGGDPLVLGRSIRLNGKLATVVGVASAEFSGLSLDKADLWVPINQQPYFVEGSRLLTDFSADGGVKVWGRLQRGSSPEAAEDELRTLAAELRKQYPRDIWEGERLPSEPGGYATSLIAGDRHGSGAPPTGEMYPVIGLIGALALLILTVACGNLGSLMLARGVAREREIAIRAAIGAGRGRLIRQLFTESLLLALLGSAAGVGLGYFVLRVLMAWTAIPAWLNPAPDWRVIGFAIAIAFVAALLFGLTPALQVARQRHRSTRVRQFLIGAQVAGSCVLLIVAGLLVRALDRASTAHPGFEYEQVVSIDPGLARHGFSSARARVYLDDLESRLRGLPGIESVALASTLPLGNKVVAMTVEIEGRRLDVHMTAVDPDYLQTMSIPIVEGRNLAGGDTRAIVVSKAFARLQWPAESALGKPFPMGVDAAGAAVNYAVVGVSADARVVARQDPDGVEAYTLAEASDLPSMVVLAKTAGPPEGAVPFLASMARGVDPKVSPEIQMLKSSFRRKLQGPQYSTRAVSVLGLAALLLACLGLVGLVTYAVAQRTREIGIRMALGAKPAEILAVVLSQFRLPVAIGLLVGVGGAAALSQILRRELYGVSGLDPIAYMAAVGLFVVTVTLAALWPARRALQVDPLVALRHE